MENRRISGVSFEKYKVYDNTGKFTRMIEKKDSIVSLYSKTINDARELDTKYREYVDKRCLNYKSIINRLLFFVKRIKIEK